MKRFRFGPVALSQIILAATLVICTVIEPHYLFSYNQGGVSNFGVYRQTGFIFALGFVVAVSLLVAAAKRFREQNENAFSNILEITAVLFGLNLASTVLYKQSTLLDDLHNWVAIVLVTVQLALAGYMFMQFNRDRQTVLSFSLQVVGFVLITLTFTGQLHVLFTAEVLVAAGYGWLLIRTASILLSASDSNPPSKPLK